jgi:hypothetical protein
MRPSLAPSAMPLALIRALTLALTAVLVMGLGSLAAAAPATSDSPSKTCLVDKLTGSQADDVKIEIVASARPRYGEPDQVHIICRSEDDNVDLALPRRWVNFVVRHLDGDLGLDSGRIDLELLWETVENLGPGEEILIQDRKDKIRIWLD